MDYKKIYCSNVLHCIKMVQIIGKLAVTHVNVRHRISA